MTIENIIFGTGILVGLFLFGITKSKFLKGIIIGLTISYVLTLFKIQLLTTIGFIIFGILSLAYSIHSGKNTNWKNFIIGIFSFASFLFGILNWAYGGELQLSMVIPIVVYLTLFLNWKKYKNEISILTIFVAYEITLFLDIIKQWVN